MTHIQSNTVVVAGRLTLPDFKSMDDVTKQMYEAFSWAIKKLITRHLQQTPSVF